MLATRKKTITQTHLFSHLSNNKEKETAAQNQFAQSIPVIKREKKRAKTYRMIIDKK